MTIELSWEPDGHNKWFASDGEGNKFSIIKTTGLWKLYHNGEFIGSSTKEQVQVWAEERRTVTA